jgi:cytochrome b pre-mRNA-processing protein 3
MFKDMDRSLREMGASDVGVGPKVRRMAEVFYGRTRVYSEALQQTGEARRQALVSALARNVYAGGDEAGAGRSPTMCWPSTAPLASARWRGLLSGEAGFVEPEAGLSPA